MFNSLIPIYVNNTDSENLHRQTQILILLIGLGQNEFMNTDGVKLTRSTHLWKDPVWCFLRPYFHHVKLLSGEGRAAPAALMNPGQPGRHANTRDSANESDEGTLCHDHTARCRWQLGQMAGWDLDFLSVLERRSAKSERLAHWEHWGSVSLERNCGSRHVLRSEGEN